MTHRRQESLPSTFPQLFFRPLSLPNAAYSGTRGQAVGFQSSLFSRGTRGSICGGVHASTLPSANNTLQVPRWRGATFSGQSCGSSGPTRRQCGSLVEHEHLVAVGDQLGGLGVHAVAGALDRSGELEFLALVVAGI